MSGKSRANADPKNFDAQGRFVKGHSIRSPGRPREPEEFRRLAREASIEALQYCIAVMRDERESTKYRLRAAELIIERAWGKPRQEIGINDGAPVAVVLDVFGRAAQEAAARGWISPAGTQAAETEEAQDAGDGE